MRLREFFGLKPNVDMSKLPGNVGRLTGNQEHGPNCWNATMLFFHADEIVRYVSDPEMVEWLEKHTTEDYFKRCAPGSIVAMYNDNSNQTKNHLWHTAVWVAPGILWHKFGCAGPWEFVTEKQLREYYPEVTRIEYRLFKGKAA